MKGPADSAIRIGGPFSTLNPEQSLMENPADLDLLSQCEQLVPAHQSHLVRQ